MKNKETAVKAPATSSKKTSVGTKNKSWGDRHRAGIKK
jgi:hypothetical protein